MKDLVTNLILLVYLGVVFVHKLLGYSYFTGAWRSAIFIAAILILILIGITGYNWIIDNALAQKQPEPEGAQTGGGEQK
ncbi:MAG: hypothetical protein K9N46_07260 [Candidatus Marinimicrobia bacterium]|nr:hypothetical protein [Candidatus Neomarinimicrobiota bacterium]MCF7880520.1 hypothetical protein [Candidatus Neomarinimicrobiota bacterium]